METMNYDFTKAFNKEMSRVFHNMDTMDNGSDWKCTEYGASDMVKFVTSRLAERHTYCSFCGTGSGKTGTSIYASRTLGCKTMVIISPNSVKTHWEDEIIKYYGKKGNRIINVNSLDDIKAFNTKMYNYIIFNFDKFSIASGNEAVDKLVSLNKIDFLCIDELHNLKVRYEEHMSNRHEVVFRLRKMAGEKNPDMYVLGMTATPHINNFTEVRSLVELVTGVCHPEIENRNSYINFYRTCKTLENIGFRYIHDTGIKVNYVDIHIDGTDILPELVKAIKDKDIVGQENILIEKKLASMEVLKWVKPGSVLFTQYRDAKNDDAIINTVTSKLDEMGLTHKEYTGSMAGGVNAKKKLIDGFEHHEFDVFVGTKPMVEGVDGLQYRSNILVMLGYTDNAKGNTQLIGRINRQGQQEKEVFIVRPIVDITLPDGEVVSFDQKRINHIDKLQRIADLAVDGRFEEHYNLNRNTIDRRLRKKIQEATDYTPERETL